MIKKLYGTLKSLLINPYKGLIPFSEFKRIKKLPRFKHDKTVLFGKDFYFSDNFGFLCSLMEILVDEQNKFKSINQSPVIFDCGSNIGLSIIHFKRQYPHAQIEGFEPDDQIFNILQQNVKSFNLDGVTLHKAAIWNEDTELDFFSDGSLAGSLEEGISTNINANLVKAVRLKNLIQNKQIDFLKIDIEGAESTVIFDIQEELKKVQVFFLEYHSVSGKDQDFGNILNVITNSGFRYYIKNHNDYLKYPFYDKAREGFDMQLSIFCYRD